MKKFLKVAAIAAAMIALCVSCEKDDKSIDGKQFVFDMEEVLPCCLDFGVTKAGTLIMAMDMYGEYTVETWKESFAGILEDEEELAAFAQQMYDATHGKYINALPYDYAYEVVPADSKSGKVVLTFSAGEGGRIPFC